MSQTAITLAFENWKAQQGATGEPVLLDEFVFASVPDLNPDTPVDRNEVLPPAAQIVYRQSVTRTGVVNENGVVYSVVLGADVGDFSFNWIGLLNKASGTLAMIVHAPSQQKLKTKEGQQGNVLTRSFQMEYNGAQTETGINTPAETWQIDFTARMAGMDERQRLENMDIYGAAAFFGNGYLVAKTGNQFFVTKGTGYVAGLRASLAANQNITVTTKPVKVWLDVCWTGTLTSVWNVQSKITVAANLADYVQNGVQHYVFAVASIDVDGNITDLRPKGTLNEQQASDALKKHEQSRNHPDASTTEKGFVQLNSATDSNSEKMAATPLAVKTSFDAAKKANENADGRVSKSGDKMTGKLELPQTSSFGVNTDNTLGGNSIALGKGNTGFKQNGNGALDAIVNNVQSMRITDSAVQVANKSGPWISMRDQNCFSGQEIVADSSASAIVRQEHSNKHYILGGLGRSEFGIYMINKSRDTNGTDGRACMDASGNWVCSGQMQPANWGNFDNRYAFRDNISYVGIAGADDNRPYVRSSVSGNAIILARQDWVSTYFVSGVQRGAKGSMTMDGALVEAPAGCFLTGGNGNEGNQVGVALYRPLQIYRNGAWATISG